MTTASPWKNFLRAFTLSVGTCLSAASNKSVATCATLTPLGRFGRFGNVTPKAFAEDCAAGLGLSLVCEVLESCETDAIIIYSVVAVRGLSFLDLANCRFHPATLRHPSRPQYASSAGRCHFFFPSRIRCNTHNHGSRLPSSHRVHSPIRPEMMTTAPA